MTVEHAMPGLEKLPGIIEEIFGGLPGVILYEQPG
jgi:hypothetical protein